MARKLTVDPYGKWPSVKDALRAGRNTPLAYGYPRWACGRCWLEIDNGKGNTCGSYRRDVLSSQFRKAHLLSCLVAPTSAEQLGAWAYAHRELYGEVVAIIPPTILTLPGAISPTLTAIDVRDEGSLLSGNYDGLHYHPDPIGQSDGLPVYRFAFDSEVVPPPVSRLQPTPPALKGKLTRIGADPPSLCFVSRMPKGYQWDRVVRPAVLSMMVLD